MNNLKNARVYLAGPIDLDHDPLSWREYITRFLILYGCKVIDPTKKNSALVDETAEAVAKRKALKEAGDYAAVKKLMQPIIRWDLDRIDKSDLIIFRYDRNIPVFGTVWENCVASLERKPCLVFSTSGKKTLPDWLIGISPLEHLFEDIDELCGYLDALNDDISVDTTGRFTVI